jgi:iron complex transport system ATP-binding protein
VRPLLEARGLDVRIGATVVCAGLDLAIAAGTSWGILGRSGIGKTTLLHTLAGLRHPDGGEVRWRGEPIDRLPRRRLAQALGVVLQHDDYRFPLAVLDAALAGRHPHLGRWQAEGPADRSLARTALKDVGLGGLEARLADSLSGGERRRLALATLLTQDPQLALLDEPVNHLDPGQQLSVVDLLRRRFRAADRALVVVLHDVNLALRCCSHLLLLYGDGHTRGGETGAIATAPILSELYGHPLVPVQVDGRPGFLPR